jgi:hypothetical protein
VVQLPRNVLLGLVHAYRWTLKPWLGSACRFEPTCSQYALDALRRHGALAGAGLSGWRLLRCHPWCDGGCDPVPERLPGLFTRFGIGDADVGPAAAAAPTLPHRPHHAPAAAPTPEAAAAATPTPLPPTNPSLP